MGASVQINPVMLLGKMIKVVMMISLLASTEETPFNEKAKVNLLSYWYQWLGILISQKELLAKLWALKVLFIPNSLLQTCLLYLCSTVID